MRYSYYYFIIITLLIVLSSSAASAEHAYAIQVGAFQEQENAERFAQSCATFGEPVYIDASTNIFRVRIGAFSSIVSAKAKAERLYSNGQVSSYLIVQRVINSGGEINAVELPEPGVRGESVIAAAVKPESESSTHLTVGLKVVEFALKFQGIPYKYGGTTVFGFDCSGFVQAMYRLVGVTLPRTAADQFHCGQAIDKNLLQPGDLVFFSYRNRRIGHVGIYVGDDDFLHAPRTGTSISISSLTESYYSSHFQGARRPY